MSVLPHNKNLNNSLACSHQALRLYLEPLIKNLNVYRFIDKKSLFTIDDVNTKKREKKRMYTININREINKDSVMKLIKSNFAGTKLQAVYDCDGDLVSGLEYNPDNNEIIIESRYDIDDDDYMTDGYTRVDLYDIGDYFVFIQDGDNNIVNIEPKNTTWIDYFSDWDIEPQSLEKFGIDINDILDITDADESDTDVSVWCTHRFVADSYDSTPSDYVRDEDGDVIIFDTFADADEWIDEKIEGVYMLSNGEIAAPTYKVVKVD
ncbi:hypothetical protein [Marinobacter nauticus]|uniref:hypothetical protein n=1 Tax=Marinobacter nauticus TaxID=2743 RepID=UPI001C995D51|nr:hypothetical protein [Marinobacter nauticus]MBY5962102.1 hypothetical protein [Marinobacter nauticus]